MFFVLFFIIYLGNVYYQMAQVDNCVRRAAIKGAQCIVNPQQYDTVHEGRIPLSIPDVEPYRYIFGELPGGSLKEIERKIGEDLLDELEHKTDSFFIKMSPRISKNGTQAAQFNNYVLYSTFQTQVEYEIHFPIRFIFFDKPVVMKLCARAEEPVNDTPEFIRNVDLVVDMFCGTRAGKNITDAFTKVNNFITSFESGGESGGGGGEDKTPGSGPQESGGEQRGGAVPVLPPASSDTPKPPDDPGADKDEEDSKATTATDWEGKTDELAKSSPVNIPDDATVKVQHKAGGYDQISYKWSDGTYKYEARWHTPTPNAPEGSPNSWVVERTKPGTPTGRRKFKVYIHQG